MAAKVCKCNGPDSQVPIDVRCIDDATTAAEELRTAAAAGGASGGSGRGDWSAYLEKVNVRALRRLPDHESFDTLLLPPPPIRIVAEPFNFAQLKTAEARLRQKVGEWMVKLNKEIATLDEEEVAELPPGV
ncbi:hypothetical protein OC835_007939 [Tilletia horrida]|nr:hypothetical protein OC835_007939 [Tilletia horrida]